MGKVALLVQAADEVLALPTANAAAAIGVAYVPRMAAASAVRALVRAAIRALRPAGARIQAAYGALDALEARAVAIDGRSDDMGSASSVPWAGHAIWAEQVEAEFAVLSRPGTQEEMAAAQVAIANLGQ